ncbi:MAG: hypothetical protein ACREIC_17630 [Limisphaerales bacterium]
MGFIAQKDHTGTRLVHFHSLVSHYSQLHSFRVKIRVGRLEDYFTDEIERFQSIVENYQHFLAPRAAYPGLRQSL